jgi:hypothetical protein
MFLDTGLAKYGISGKIDTYDAKTGQKTVWAGDSE